MDKRIKIGHIIMGFVLLILIFFVVYAGYQGMNEVEKKSRAIHNMTFIVNNMQGALEAEQNYVIYGDPIYREEVYFYLSLVPEQAAISKEIYIGYLDSVNRDRMDIVLAASSNFSESFDRYVEADDEQAELRNKLSVDSEILITKTDELSKNQMAQYREELKDGYSNESLEKKLSNVESAHQIILLTMKAQNEYLNYTISPNKEHVDSFNTFMGDIIELSMDLNRRMERPENIATGKEILQSAEDFQADFEQFKVLEERKAIEVSNMAITAEQVEEVAQAAIVSLRTEEGANTDTKEETDNEEKTIFDVYFLKNLISESVVAFITGLLGLIGTIIVAVYFNKRTNDKN